jgi:two-component system sensor histidine kinase/response regulator
MASTDLVNNRSNGVAAETSEATSDSDPPQRVAISRTRAPLAAGPASRSTPWPIRVGLVLLLLFELTYFATDLLFVKDWRALGANVFNIVAIAATVVVLDGSFFQRHWRGVSLALFISLIVSTTICGVLLDRFEWPFVTVILLMLGAGTLVPWNNNWQFALTFSSLAAIAVGRWDSRIGDANLISHWGALFAAAGLSHCMTVLGQRYRRELRRRIRALDQNHSNLLAQIAEREAAVAERERALQRLRESEAQLRRVFDTSLDAIAINRLHSGQFVNVNREFTATFGYRLDEIQGRSTTEFGIWARPEEWQSLLDRLDSDGMVRNMDVELRTKHGRSLAAQISAAVEEIDGEPCVISVTRDISTIKGAQAELVAARESAVAASKAKSEFVSSISHEIRTPMNAILGTADLLSDTALSFEQRHYLDTMRDNGNAMLAVINGVLDLSRVESGRLGLESVEFDLREVVERTLEALATSAHAKKLELAARITPGVPTALIGDPMRLRQILVNLIGNAIKFTEQGEVAVTIETIPAVVGEIKPASQVSAHNSGYGLFRISVADTGVGIALDRRDAIFAGFAQASASTAREYGGSGLGLAIVKRLVELMKGRIELTSEVGQGSTFTIVVPLELQAVAGAKNEIVANDAGLRGKRVLIADDSAINRLIAEEWLTANGAEAKCVNDGTEALAEIRRARSVGSCYHLLLLDARMPGMDGVTLAQLLIGGRRDQAAITENIVVMLMSDELAVSLSRMRESGLDPNAHCRYVVKPLKRADVLGAILGALALNRNGGPPEQTLPQSPPAVARVERSLRILLAEDSVDNRLLVEAFLKQQPYTLEFAENGQIAIDRVLAASYDLVLMDIQMPMVDGYTAVRRIREWERIHDLPRVPIIALTASALDEAVRMSLEAGCDAHIAKPVRKATLLEAIRKGTSSRYVTDSLSGSKEAHR